jgi:hypothetical protein
MGHPAYNDVLLQHFLDLFSNLDEDGLGTDITGQQDHFGMFEGLSDHGQAKSIGPVHTSNSAGLDAPPDSPDSPPMTKTTSEGGQHGGHGQVIYTPFHFAKSPL